MPTLTRDNVLVLIGMIMVIVLIVSTVLTGSTITREVAEGKLSSRALVRGVSSVLGLAVALWALVVAVGL
jgi:hypothetical protein